MEKSGIASPNEARARQSGRGFTIIELMVSLVIISILAAVAIPSIYQGWNSYRLTSAASGVAGILQRTRFEAIHNNGRLSCVYAPLGNGWQVGIDENSNGLVDPNEPQVMLPGPATIVAPGVAPGPASMGYAGAVTPPGGVVTFDARGTIFFGPNPPNNYVIYFGMPNLPRYGYRAISITPMGQVKVWTASAGGAWTAE